jgi:hypothetical protein
MTQTKDDGGQAFPCPGMTGLPNDELLWPSMGMSLRDYFAAQALVAAGTWSPLPSDKAHYYGTQEDAAARASWAYRIADSMLTQRDKP